MPRRAWAYIGGVYTAGTILTILAISDLTTLELSSQWPILLGLAFFATLAQLFKVEAPDHQLYHTTLVFLFAGVVLLQPGLFVFLVMIPHLIEWVRERIVDSIHLRDWYLQPFNIFIHILVGLTARWVYTGIEEQMTSLGVISILVASVSAAVVYVVLNHFLIGLAIVFGRGVTLRESGILEIGNLITDLVTLLMGYTVAVFWEINFWLIWIALTPLILIYRALTIPILERQAQMDAKTEVWNAGYFNNVLQEELTRAQGFNRPLTLVMADLDLLRVINNTYGHIAGDIVLQGVAAIMRDAAQAYDIVARFGGEEFAILLPETTAEEAYDRVEKIRQAIESTEFTVPTSSTPIKATMSFGIAVRLGDDQSSTEFIHSADIALYQAKKHGRNRTYVYDYERDKSLKMPNAVSIIPKVEPISSYSESSATTTESFNQEISETADQDKTKVLEPQKATFKSTPIIPVDAYIAAMMILAISLSLFLIRFTNEIDWLGLIAFAIVVLLVEALSIEIYLRDTTVSTSAAPLMAGILLFGPAAAIILAPIIAIVVIIKQRSTIKRLIFNASNHMIGGLLCAWLITLGGRPFTEWPLWVQFILSVATAGFVYLTTTGLLTGAMSLDSNQHFWRIWAERFRWLVLYYLALGVVSFALIFSYVSAGLIGVVVILIPLLMLRYSQKQYIDHTEDLVKQLRVSNRDLRIQAEEITLLNEELLLTLARSIDLRDPYVMEHSKNVARYAVFTAQELGLTEVRIEQIRKAGLLHDIGKLGLPESILFKPTSLTVDEYELIKEHVNIGADLIYGCHSLRMLIPFVKHHHERFDGKGYPSQLAGEDIPLEARILNLADAVEAMASDRPYKKAMSPHAIMGEISRCTNTQFDPNVVDAFQRVLAKNGQSVIVNSARNVKPREKSVWLSDYSIQDGLPFPPD